MRGICFADRPPKHRGKKGEAHLLQLSGQRAANSDDWNVFATVRFDASVMVCYWCFMPLGIFNFGSVAITCESGCFAAMLRLCQDLKYICILFAVMFVRGFDSLLFRIAKYSECSAESLICAMVYIFRIHQRHANFYVNSLTLHRILLTAVLLGVKYLDDLRFQNEYFARLGGVVKRELNVLEVEMLFLLEFGLHITVDEYNSMLRLILLGNPSFLEHLQLRKIPPSVPSIDSIEPQHITPSLSSPVVTESTTVLVDRPSDRRRKLQWRAESTVVIPQECFRDSSQQAAKILDTNEMSVKCSVDNYDGFSATSLYPTWAFIAFDFHTRSPSYGIPEKGNDIVMLLFSFVTFRKPAVNVYLLNYSTIQAISGAQHYKTVRRRHTTIPLLRDIWSLSKNLLLS